MNLFNDLCFSVGRCKKMGDFSSSIYFLFLVKKKKGGGEPGLEPSFFSSPWQFFPALAERWSWQTGPTCKPLAAEKFKGGSTGYNALVRNSRAGSPEHRTAASGVSVPKSETLDLLGSRIQMESGT